MSYKVTPGANGTKQVRKNGKIVTNLPGQEMKPTELKTAPPTKMKPDTSETTTNNVLEAYNVVKKTEPHEKPETGNADDIEAKGEDAPALSIEVDDGNTRLYVAHPEHAEYAQNNPEEALEKGLAFPSITTCMKQIGDTEGTLQRWAVRQTAYEAEKIIKKVHKLIADGETTEAEEELSTLLQRNNENKSYVYAWLSNTDARNSNSAAQRGTEVHAITETLARGGELETPIGELPVETVGYIRAYQRFRAQFPELDIAYTEVTVINEKDQYMGTADLILKDKKGNYYVGDYKTNKYGKIYDKTGLQLAAVAKATHIVKPDGSRIPLPEIKGGIGVGLSPKGECNVVAFPTKPYYERFKTALTMWFAERKAKKNPEPSESNNPAYSYNDIVSFLK